MITPEHNPLWSALMGLALVGLVCWLRRRKA